MPTLAEGLPGRALAPLCPSPASPAALVSPRQAQEPQVAELLAPGAAEPVGRAGREGGVYLGWGPRGRGNNPEVKIVLCLL